MRLTRDGLWHATRQYTYERKRWVGDNRSSPRGDRWWASYDRAWRNAGAVFPSAAAVAVPLDEVSADDADLDAQVPSRGRTADLLDDVIAWCRIRDERSVVEIERVLHRGPGGHYAKVLDRERGTELLGACDGELTAEVLDHWVADVHEPFRGRGRRVSRLVVGSERPIDPALRAAAQVRGVEVERMIDYQRVLDTAGYRDWLRDRLDRDFAYPSEYYLEQPEPARPGSRGPELALRAAARRCRSDATKTPARLGASSGEAATRAPGAAGVTPSGSFHGRVLRGTEG